MDALEEKETYSRSPVSKIASVSNKEVLDHLRNYRQTQGKISYYFSLYR